LKTYLNKQYIEDIMKKIFFAFLLMFLMPLVLAQTEPIYNAKYLDLDVNLNSYVTIVPESSNYKIESVTATLSFIPLETWRQDIQTFETSPTADESSDSVTYKWSSPSEKKLDFSLDSSIRTLNDFYKVKSKINFPIESFPSEFIKYTQPSDKVDSDHPTIIIKANQLAAGEDDLFVIVHKLGEYVHSSIKYNLSTVNSKLSIPASEVLASKQGVCDEISVLFMALSRALGIPARFVSGISYTNSDLFTEKWGPHGWAEVYFPNYGWVPFDVTYDELGFIDASHITSKISVDPSDSSLNYQWRGKDTELQTSKLNHDVTIKSFGAKMEEFVKLIILPVRSEAGIGSYNLVELQVENLKDYYVTTTVYLARTTDLAVIEPYARTILLKPNQKKKLFWTLTINPSLDENYIYTFPLNAYTIRNTTVKTQFTSKKGDSMLSLSEVNSIKASREREEEKEVSTKISMDCFSDSEEYISGTEAKINCKFENKGNFPINNLNVCYGKTCQKTNIPLASSSSVDFVIKTSGTGRTEFFITADNEELSKSDSIIVSLLDDPLINIKDLSYPKTTSYGDSFDLKFLIEKASFSNPQKVKVVLMNNGLPQIWTLEELKQNRKMVVSFSGKELSMKNDLEVYVEYYDKNDKQFSVRDSFEINLTGVSGGQRVVIIFKDILRSIERLFS